MTDYSVDYWYRHESDDDRTIRTHCQMTGSATSEQAAYREVAELTIAGYTVQRVVMRTDCPACHGAGRIGRPPKGTRKAKISKLPAWMLKWSTCRTCRGDGWIDSYELPL